MRNSVNTQRVAKSYYWGTILAGLACWLPFKALPYVAPFIVVALLVLVGRDYTVSVRTMAWICMWAGMVVIYGLLNPEFQWGNVLVAFITWAGLVVVLMIPAKRIAEPWLQEKLTRWAWVLIALEASWGIIQAIYGFTQTGSFDLSSGDFVEGTIHPWLEAELAYSNVMFAISIVLLLLFVLPSLWRRPRASKVIVYMIGVSAFVLASVVHAILFLVAAAGIAVVLVMVRGVRIRRLVSVIGIISVIIVLGAVLLQRNLGNTWGFALQIIRGEVPKTASVVTALRAMPEDYWYTPIFGLGPGQYSSRAGLISTGLYFGGLDNPRSLPLLPNRPTESQEKYLMPLMVWHQSARYYGSTQAPYFSWLAVYTEWGLLGWFIVLGMLMYVVRAIGRISPVHDIEKLAVMTVVWFTWLLGFQENNWEVPQAWFSGMLLMKAMYAKAKYARVVLRRPSDFRAI